MAIFMPVMKAVQIQHVATHASQQEFFSPLHRNNIHYNYLFQVTLVKQAFIPKTTDLLAKKQTKRWGKVW